MFLIIATEYLYCHLERTKLAKLSEIDASREARGDSRRRWNVAIWRPKWGINIKAHVSRVEECNLEHEDSRHSGDTLLLGDGLSPALDSPIQYFPHWPISEYMGTTTFTSNDTTSRHLVVTLAVCTCLQ
ncbi:hypothetical protein J6590_081738 [Homalodisca vitripennis]|nr:hypothetical protein J6590_081738 [Homalodisca vitripennis]